MSRRIKTPTAQGRDYEQILKDYFGFHLYGLHVMNEGNRIKVQIVYEDFKHIDTVRRELAQMMPEVEFIKLLRNYTYAAKAWALGKMVVGDSDFNEPVVWVQRGNAIVQSSLDDIACEELNQLDLEDSDDIRYDEHNLTVADDFKLEQQAWD